MSRLCGRVVSVVLLVLVAAGVAGCGVPRDSQPRALNPSDVPFGLLAHGETGASEPPEGPPGFVYFVRNQHLVRVVRHIRGANRAAQLVRELLQGPTEREAAEGLSSAIPSRTRLLSLDVNRRIATLDLSREFGDLGGNDQITAVSQLVYTVTEFREITAVRFAVADKDVEVPDSSGSLSKEVHTREDYAALAPRP